MCWISWGVVGWLGSMGMSFCWWVSWIEWRDFGGWVVNFEIKICFGMGVCMMFCWRYC